MNFNPDATECPGRRGRLSAIGVFLCKSVLYGACVWARRALAWHQNRRFPARAADPDELCDYHGSCEPGCAEGQVCAATSCDEAPTCLCSPGFVKVRLGALAAGARWHLGARPRRLVAWRSC
jgi:hypothetical protein